MVVLAVGVFGFTAFRVWKVAREDHRGKVDAIVVLGAAQFNGRPSQVFQARLDHARQLFLDGVAPRVVTVGGGRPGDVFTEAAAGARYLRAHDVPADALDEVGTGDDTVTSLQAAAELLVPRNQVHVVLVTDPWHSLRSRTIAHDAGLDATTSPARTGPAVAERGTQVRYVLREASAYLYYKVFGKGPERRTPPAV